MISTCSGGISQVGSRRCADGRDPDYGERGGGETAGGRWRVGVGGVHGGPYCPGWENQEQAKLRFPQVVCLYIICHPSRSNALLAHISTDISNFHCR